MKTSKIILGLFILINLTAINSLADEFTFTTALNNITGNKAYMDTPDLTNNQTAIIVATPVGNTATLNPHPIGVYYDQISTGKYEWSIINLDQAAMGVNLTFKVEYFTQPGPDHFMYLVPSQNTRLFKAYVDNPALNNKPTVLVKTMPNLAPTTVGYNRFETTAIYDPAVGKWFIANVGSQPLEAPSAFNIVITSTLPSVKNPKADKTLNTTPKIRVKP